MRCIWDILFVQKDREDITLAAKNIFWKQFNMFIASFGKLYSFTKINFFSQFCSSFHGSPLWYLMVLQCNHYVLVGGNH